MTRRVALISEHASPLAVLGGVDSGGQNVYVAQVARHLAAAGDRVDVYTRRDDPGLPLVVECSPGMRVINVPAGPAEPVAKERLLGYMPAFFRWMQRDWAGRGLRYDVIHANFFMSGQVAADLKRALGVPYVVTFHALGKVRRLHQGAADGFPPERERIETAVIAEADRVIAECPQDEDDLIRLYGADPSRISIVPCGFDPAEFAPRDKAATRHRLGLAPDEPIILQLGRIVPRKGIDTVIEAVGRLQRTHGIRSRLLVVGGPDRVVTRASGPELARLMDLAEREGVTDLVTFVGRRDRTELADYYAAADVFVSTPWYEPFGITPLEAMACATPVVGSDVGGIKYTVRDGETGFLVPPRDPDALADRLARLLGNGRVRAAFGANGLARVRRAFTWRHVADALSGVYDEVVAERRLELATAIAATTATAARSSRPAASGRARPGTPQGAGNAR
ncbi:MAG: glycosyltransferase family 4 protein [Chloroflexota bacterium]